MIYDSFSITVLTLLEDLGFCKKGEGGRWVEGVNFALIAQSDGPALNTDGGGLSSNHPGMRGIFLLIEAARQLAWRIHISGCETRSLLLPMVMAACSVAVTRPDHHFGERLIMNEAKRPLPRSDEPIPKRFLGWLPKEKEFRYQQCKACKPLCFTPAAIAPVVPMVNWSGNIAALARLYLQRRSVRAIIPFFVIRCPMWSLGLIWMKVRGFYPTSPV